MVTHIAKVLRLALSLLQQHAKRCWLCFVACMCVEEPGHAIAE